TGEDDEPHERARAVGPQALPLPALQGDVLHDAGADGGGAARSEGRLRGQALLVRADPQGRRPRRAGMRRRGVPARAHLLRRWTRGAAPRGTGGRRDRFSGRLPIPMQGRRHDAAPRSSTMKILFASLLLTSAVYAMDDKPAQPGDGGAKPAKSSV